MNAKYTEYESETKLISEYPNQLIAHLFSRIHPNNQNIIMGADCLRTIGVADIARGGRVLEVGCGRGDFINAWHRKGFNCHAVDIGERSEYLHEDILFETVNLEEDKLPYPNNYFDIIFTKSCIEHIYNYNNFVEECKRVLKVRGFFIVMTPDWVSCHLIFYNNHTHIHPYTEVSLSNLLKKRGMDLVSCERFIQLPSVWRYPALKVLCRFLQCFGPVRKPIRKSGFIRWSRELILLAIATKGR